MRSCSTLLVALALSALLESVQAKVPAPPSPAAIDAQVQQALKDTGAKGIALAVIDHGKVLYVHAYGVRNAQGDPLQSGTIMYGASLTKAVFACAVMQLVDQRKLDLDRPIAKLLAKPLPDYATERKFSSWSDLAGDDRWRRITPRHVLTHSTGFANFGFLEPDQKLRIHFEPGTRYAYSGDGILLLQFGIEKGLGLDVGELTQDRIFKPLGMVRTSLIWRADFAGNLADGWNAQGEVQPHDSRSRVRAAGSMDTTIADFARFAAAFVSGKGLSRAARAEMVKPQLHITTAQQFPTLLPELPAERQRKDLYAGLGVVVFDGPQGRGFYKSGHDDMTGNTWVCIEARQRCIVILSNDVRAESAFPQLVRYVLGETGVPYEWEYGMHALPVTNGKP